MFYSNVSQVIANFKKNHLLGSLNQLKSLQMTVRQRKLVVKQGTSQHKLERTCDDLRCRLIRA